jgi:hypothetical protein
MAANPPDKSDASHVKLKEATDFAVSRLAQFQTRDQVMDELVERFAIQYPDAEALLDYVEQNDEAQVEARELPIVAILGIGFIVAGLALALVSLATRLSLTLLLTGVGMVIGGIIGLWQNISSLIRSLFRRSW